MWIISIILIRLSIGECEMKLRPGAQGITYASRWLQAWSRQLHWSSRTRYFYFPGLAGGGGMDSSQRAVRGNLFYCKILLGPGDFHGAPKCIGLCFKAFPIQIFTAFPVNVKMGVWTFRVRSHSALQSGKSGVQRYLLANSRASTISVIPCSFCGNQGISEFYGRFKRCKRMFIRDLHIIFS